MHLTDTSSSRHHLNGAAAFSLSSSAMFLTKLVLLAACLTSVLGTDPVPPAGEFSPLACAAGFQRLNFSTTNYASYPRYFAEDSVMTLAEAGSYFGPDDIAEYVGFAQDNSPFIDSLDSQYAKVTPVGADPVAGTCDFLITLISRYTFTRGYGIATQMDIPVGLKLTYSLVRDLIPVINVYYTKGHLKQFFGILNTRGVKRFICRTLKTKCPATHKANGSPSVGGCMRMLETLPEFSTGGYVDGYDLNCRVLHSTFAARNPDLHCAHLSFFPRKDSKGKVKCQISAQTKISDLFTPAELAAHNAAVAEAGIDPVKGFRLPCDKDTAGWRTPVGDGSGGCNFVRKFPLQRCLVKEALYACPKTCNDMCTKTA